mmetsp:Transcript_2782/g.3813  ORF Transcript_2782/g.3813 Transcript_2782/m.3813 type:complete len:232 (-) Transcript_2782:1113-1808(-)
MLCHESLLADVNIRYSSCHGCAALELLVNQKVQNVRMPFGANWPDGKPVAANLHANGLIHLRLSCGESSNTLDAVDSSKHSSDTFRKLCYILVNVFLGHPGLCHSTTDGCCNCKSHDNKHSISPLLHCFGELTIINCGIHSLNWDTHKHAGFFILIHVHLESRFAKLGTQSHRNLLNMGNALDVSWAHELLEDGSTTGALERWKRGTETISTGVTEGINESVLTSHITTTS